MNQGHVQSGEVINLQTLKGDMQVNASYAIVKTADMEVIRMALPAGKEVPQHHLEGEMSVQCLRGEIQIKVGDQDGSLKEDDWLHVHKKQPFSFKATVDTILLLTILFTDPS